MRVLIGCEESGTVRDAFARHGHDAWSCDLEPSRSLGNHLQIDIFEAIRHYGRWDLIILHPPCDYLAVSGNRWYGKQDKHGNPIPGYAKRLEAIHWTNELWFVACMECNLVALENPVSVIFAELDNPKPWTVQYIQPWQFGHGETKRTGFALHNLPELEPTDIVEGREQVVWKMGPSPTRKRDRSATYLGVADAMAAQWGALDPNAIN